MIRFAIAAAAAAIALTGAEAEPSEPLRARIDALVGDGAVIPGAIVTVKAPDTSWTYAHGSREIAGAALQPTDEFRIASVTKSFVAAAILRLWEDGKLSIDAPIESVVTPDLISALRTGGYNVQGVTVRMLLNHSSGIRDFSTTSSYARAIASDPGHSWTRAEQIGLAVKGGKPLAAPGTRAAYSDTNYVLLGDIIERTTQKPLGDAVSALVGFERLRLKRTYWELLPTGLATVPSDRAHAYEGKIDTAALNPSFDWYGGGGLVSTTQDLLTYFEALLEGRVFDRPETLAAMTAIPAKPLRDRDGSIYGLGVQLYSIGDAQCWGHPGHWATLAMWCPDTDRGFAFTLNAAGSGAYRRATQLSAKLAEELKGQK